MGIKIRSEPRLERKQTTRADRPRTTTRNNQRTTTKTTINMKTVAAASAALLSLASLASAQQQQTKPFWLVIKDAGKYNGAALVACHEGAAIEGLCVGDKPGHGTRLSTFQFNTTAGAITSDPTAGETGTLTYALPVNGGVETGMFDGCQLAK